MKRYHNRAICLSPLFSLCLKTIPFGHLLNPVFIFTRFKELFAKPSTCIFTHSKRNDTTLKRSYKWPLFKTHFLRLSGNKIDFFSLQNLCISIDERLVALRNSVIPPHSFFLFKSAKINFFGEKRDLSVVFIELR